MKVKHYADIEGKYWEVDYPFCAGCPHLTIPTKCVWEGNGCQYPNHRKTRPISFRAACFALIEKYAPSESIEEVLTSLGSCCDSKKEEGHD